MNYDKFKPFSYIWGLERLELLKPPFTQPENDRQIFRNNNQVMKPILIIILTLFYFTSFSQTVEELEYELSFFESSEKWGNKKVHHLEYSKNFVPCGTCSSMPGTHSVDNLWRVK
jgi:hypothetical protein